MAAVAADSCVHGVVNNFDVFELSNGFVGETPSRLQAKLLNYATWLNSMDVAARMLVVGVTRSVYVCCQGCCSQEHSYSGDSR